MNDNEARRAHFEKWRAGLDVFLDQLREGIPGNVALDYSLDSLISLEAWPLARYPDLPAAPAENFRNGQCRRYLCRRDHSQILRREVAA